MATSLSPNRLPFHALLDDPAKCTKNSTAETLLAIAERNCEGSIASNGAFVTLTGAHSGRSPKELGNKLGTDIAEHRAKP